MSEKFDAIIVTTAADYKRVRCNVYKKWKDKTNNEIQK